MIFTKPNLYGIDKKISLIQRILDKRLTSWGTVSIYGAIEENIKDGNLIPEVYTGIGEYKELYLDDTKAAQICFRILSRDVNKSSHSAQVDIIFNVNLTTIHGNTNRESERALLEAYNSLIKSAYITDITGIKEGVTDVYNGLYTGQLTNKDMQPFYIFAITCNVNYSISLC
jgi:hypothetical protein